MTEIEYVIANFAERFEAFRGKRIVLHGSRNYAEAIIANFSEAFQFVGIMTLDAIDSDVLFGLKVLKEGDISALNIDLIILTERVKYEIEAFHAIRRVCRKNRIALYNMYGLDEFLVHREAEEAGELTLEEAKKLCSSHDIISFEVMDTVLYSPIALDNLSVRKFFRDLIMYLREQNKEIRFSLRKSFPADIQIKSLERYDLLINKERELIWREGEDLSFRKLKEDNQGKKIIYFGSGLPNEFILPRCYGIHTCRFVDVHSFNSMVPGKRESKKKYSFSPNLKKSIEEKILEKDLISFDVFDTLLVRKTLYPQDVFYLTEQKALQAGYAVSGFVPARIRAEREDPFYNIDQIYTVLEEYFEWSVETTYIIKSLELETEKEVLLPRAGVVDLFRFAIEAGKRIILTSDMYLPETVLQKFLEGNKISGYEKLLVSCDIKKSKHTGLFKELIKICGKPGSILHIGDNPVADGIDCELYGIESIRIPSALEMASYSGWEESIRFASNLMERCLLGLIVSKLFLDPFQNPALTELSAEKQIQRYGVTVVSSLVVGHMTWLMQKLREKVFNGVLFFARDGWLSYNVYRKLGERFSLPTPVYFYANRRATFLCCADLPQETEHILELKKVTGFSASKIMENIYQFSKEEILPYKERDSVTDYIEKHMNRIQEKADKARKSYLLYFRKCGLSENGTYAVVDGFASGNTQKNLSQFLPLHMKGLYFGNNSATPLSDETEYYLQGENPLLLQRFIELETYFTSLEPSQSSMSGEGKPVFLKEKRSRQELEVVGAVLKQAVSFALEFFEHFYLERQDISPRLIEEIYAAENYYEAQFVLYDDWSGLPIRKREEAEKEEKK